MNKRQSIGLWGCGNMARSLVEGLAATDEADLAAVYDVSRDAAESMAKDTGAAVCESAADMFASKELDGVIIALPPDLHEQATIETAQAGISVFVEKPMALNVAGCRRMIDAAKKGGVQLMVGHVLRYYEPYRSILRWKSEKRFGRLRAASIWRLSSTLKPGAETWRFQRARSGGLFFEVGIHELDMMRCFFGKPETVRLLRQDEGRNTFDMSDFLSLQIRFENGAVSTYEAGAGTFAGSYGFRLFFDEVTMMSDSVFDPSALRVLGRDGGADPEMQSALKSEMSEDNPVASELRDWLAAIRGDKPVAVAGEDGLATVALVEAAYRSAENGESTVEYTL